jgi:hypothetical protein
VEASTSHNPIGLHGLLQRDCIGLDIALTERDTYALPCRIYVVQMGLDLNYETLGVEITPRHGTPTEPNFGLSQIDSLSVAIRTEAGDPRHMLKTICFCDVTLSSLVEPATSIFRAESDIP